MVMQEAADTLVSGSNPGEANRSGAAAGVHQPGFEPPTKKFAAWCVTIRPGVDMTQLRLPLLGAFSAKTFDPPPTTTPPYGDV